MGNTEDDAKWEMHQLDMAEEAAEDYYRDLFGDEVTANELNAYAMWLYQGLQAAEKLNKSAPRATICVALAGMPNYMIDHVRDFQVELAGVNMLEAITPPSGHPAWGSYGRPKTLFHHLHRMEGNDKNGKPVDLIEVGYYPSEPDAIGKVMKTYKLTRTGILYAHIHGTGNVTKDDVVRYWRHETQGVEVAATNHHYLALIGQEPAPDNSIYQYQTTGWAMWGVLDYLKREDLTVPERYRNVNASTLGKGLKDVYANDVGEAMKCLNKEDQRLLCGDVLLHSKVDNVDVREDFIDNLMKKDVTYKDKFKKLVKAYESAHPDRPADQIVGELICRTGWMVIRRVMDFRMNDGYEGQWGHVVNAPPKRLTREQMERVWDEHRNMESQLSEEAAEERAADQIAELQGEARRGS